MIIIFWLLCGIVGAMIGSNKGEGGLGFFLGLLLGPIGVLIVALSRGNRRKCPFCVELVNNKAIVCPHCQREIR